VAEYPQARGWPNIHYEFQFSAPVHAFHIENFCMVSTSISLPWLAQTRGSVSHFQGRSVTEHPTANSSKYEHYSSVHFFRFFTFVLNRQFRITFPHPSTAGNPAATGNPFGPRKRPVVSILQLASKP
jgi:hypothetical protein